MLASELLQWCEDRSVNADNLLEKYWGIFIATEATHALMTPDHPSYRRMDWQLDDLWQLIEGMENAL